jgi:F-type H+-transporting ATPase subunit c
MEGINGGDLIKAFALLAAGIAMGFGAIGPGIGEGFAAGKACESLGKRPDEANLITRTMLIGQAVSETTGIYSLVVALILIFMFGKAG